MVKRVKDMTQKPTDDVKADAKRVVEEVKEITSVVNMSSESEDSRKSSKNKQVVTDVCPLCEMGIAPEDIDFYNIALLKKFLSVRGKIIARTKTGLCAKHQRVVTRAIKRARYVALLPYVNTGV